MVVWGFGQGPHVAFHGHRGLISNLEAHRKEEIWSGRWGSHLPAGRQAHGLTLAGATIVPVEAPAVLAQSMESVVLAQRGTERVFCKTPIVGSIPTVASKPAPKGLRRPRLSPTADR